VARIRMAHQRAYVRLVLHTHRRAIPPRQCDRFRHDAKLCVSAGVYGLSLPGFWSPQAFARLNDDFWRFVSASKNSVPGDRVEREVRARLHARAAFDKRLGCAPLPSGLPQLADFLRVIRHVSKVSLSDSWEDHHRTSFHLPARIHWMKNLPAANRRRAKAALQRLHAKIVVWEHRKNLAALQVKDSPK
jgi:hypothetical protein